MLSELKIMNWLSPDIHTVTKFYGLSYFFYFTKIYFSGDRVEISNKFYFLILESSKIFVNKNRNYFGIYKLYSLKFS